MLRFFNKRLHNRKGFTLIELIVVIAILAILALIAIPRLTGFQEKAKISADLATFETITKSISIGAINGDLTGNITMATDADGKVSFTSTVTGEDAKALALFEQTPVFKLKINASKTGKVWTISNGVVTAPTINLATGAL